MENELIEIKALSIGGQGIVTGIELLTRAISKAGYRVQSFSTYGTERRGGRVESYLRFSKGEILLHSRVYEADYLVLTSEDFIKDNQVLSSVKEGGTVLINSLGDFPPLGGDVKIITIDAERIAIKHGIKLRSGMPVINTTIAGALLALLPGVHIDHLVEIMKEEAIPAVERNIEATWEAYQKVTGEVKVDATNRTEERGNLEKPLERPVYDREKMSRCNRCMICYIFCPDLAISFDTDPFSLNINYDVCKGCGICIEECPRKAIAWRQSDD